MRQSSGIPLTIAISAIVHVGLFGAAHWLPDPPRIHQDEPFTIELLPPPLLAETTVAKPPDATDPIEVVFLGPEPAEGVRPLGAISVQPADKNDGVRPLHAISVQPADNERSSAAVPALETVAVAGSSTSRESSDNPPARNPYLDMRRAPRPDVAVRGWDDLDNVPKGTTPEKDISTGQLAPDGGGTHKSDQGPFTAKIDKDGSVKLRDKKNFNIHLTLPSAKDIGDMFQAWYYDPNKPVGTLGPPNMPSRRANLSREDVSGAERLNGDDSSELEKDPYATSGGGIPIAAGGFDITDAFMRSKGSDPYASKKLAFLDSTRDERVQIGTRYKSQQLAQVAQIVKKNLARLWAATKDPQQRKQALFEMWDECIESGSEEVVHAADTARKMIVGFMRANFPVGSDHAFTTTEIAACNRAKQSRATFSPYE